MDDTLIMTGLTQGRRARIARLALGLRQLDLASQASVSLGEITALEHDRYVRPSRLEAILRVLGLLDDKEDEVKG